LLPAHLRLVGKFPEIVGGEKALCRRTTTKANNDVVRRMAAAPTVAADASDGNSVAALIQAVRRENAKVTIDVGSRMKVRYFIYVCRMSGCSLFAFG
jgi:hypothetical protein